MDFDFGPRSTVPPSELEPLLEAWFGQSPSPATNHLASLWAKPQLRARIAEVAATELAEWDGSDEASSDGHNARSRVVLSMELTSFPSRRLGLSPLFFAAQPGITRVASLVTSAGEVEVELEPALNGALMFAERGLVGAQDLIEGTLRLVDPIAGSMERQAKRVVVFKKDELSGRWLEARQVLMGDDVAVLASGPALAKTSSILAEVARPGWTLVESIAGLPDGWTLIRGVEIFSRPEQTVPPLSEFSALVPLTTSQLKLGGGLVLPSAARNLWHVRRPPEIRAIDNSGSGIEVRLIDKGAPGASGDEHLIDLWGDGGSGSVVVDLAGAELSEGDYAIELVVGGGMAKARKELLLRSSDNPDGAHWATVLSIVHDAGDPLVVLGAGSAAGDWKPSGPSVQGVVLDEVPLADAVGALASTPWWNQAADAEQPSVVRLGRPAPGSCFYTGAHHEELEPAMFDSRGRPVTKFTTGKCKFCGLQRRYSSSYWTNKRKHDRAMAQDVPRRTQLRDIPVRSDGDAVDWDLALDALRYVGGGAMASLERVARQMDPSSLFLHQFVSTLEALGHIEIRRSPETLNALSWEVCPTTVIDVGQRRVFAGYWTPDMVASATAAFAGIGHSCGSDPQVGSAQRVWSTASLDELLGWTEFGAIAGTTAAGMQIASVLPTMSELVAALPRRTAPSLLGFHWFEPTTASWQMVTDMDAPGAYRVGRFGASYYFRTAEDVTAERCALGNASLVKHAAAVLLTGRALAAYDEASAELVVPLGASLPGMFERAAVLESGLAPARRRGSVIYRDVSPALAGRLAYLLEN